MSLVKQRNQWLEDYRSWCTPPSKVLAEYRENRDSEDWAVSEEIEQLCEYILYLENEVDEWMESSEYSYMMYDDLMSTLEGEGE